MITSELHENLEVYPNNVDFPEDCIFEFSVNNNKYKKKQRILRHLIVELHGDNLRFDTFLTNKIIINF